MANAEIKVTGKGDFSQYERSIAAMRQKTNAETEKIRRSFENLNKGAGSLAGLAGGVVSVATVRSLVGLADAYTNMNARLSLVTKGTEDFARVQAQLIKIAEETRAPLTGTVDLYTNIARATRDLGVDQAEVAQVVTNLSKALVISGGDAHAAQLALIQLGQGFAAGELRGENLNSVIEQTPRIAQAIAEGLGIGIGKLREMAKEGKVTAEAAFGALLSQTGALNAEFARMPVTAGQGFTAMANSFTLMIGKINESIGATAKLADAFKTVGNLIGDLEGTANRFNPRLRLESLQKSLDLWENTLRNLQSDRFDLIDSLGIKSKDSRIPEAQAQIESLRKQIERLRDSNALVFVPPPAAITRSDVNNADRDRALRDLEQAKRQFAALDKDTPKEKLANKIREIRELGLRAEETEAEIARAVRAATPKGSGGESVFVRIKKELEDLQDELNKVNLGKTEATLLDLQRKGATPGQVDQARSILDQIEARKTLKDLESDQLEIASQRSAQEAEETKSRAETTRIIMEEVEQRRLEISTLGQSDAARRTAITMLEAERAGIQANTAEWFQLRDAVLASNKAYDDATRLQGLLADTDTAHIAAQTADIKLLTEALQEYIATGGVSGISESTYLEAVSARLDLVKEKTGELSEFTREAARSMQSALSDFFFKPTEDGFDDMLDNFGRTIKRMAADALSAKLLESLFGDYAKSKELGGLLGSVGRGGSGGSTAAAVPASSIAPSRATKSGPAVVYQTNNFNQDSSSGMTSDQITRMLKRASVEAVSERQSRNGRF